MTAQQAGRKHRGSEAEGAKFPLPEDSVGSPTATLCWAGALQCYGSNIAEAMKTAEGGEPETVGQAVSRCAMSSFLATFSME
jgi:hypothetical protein